MEPYVTKRIRRQREDGSSVESDDYVAIEKRISIALNRKEVAVLYCTPSFLPELITGHLTSSGMLPAHISLEDLTITLSDNVAEVRFNAALDAISSIGPAPDTGSFQTADKQARGELSLPAHDIISRFREFNERAELFRLTGCFHSAGLSDGTRIWFLAEDIGRHNAADKIIGYSFINSIPLSDKLVLLSCRLASEILSKFAHLKVPIIASRAAPTDRAIEIAKKAGITMIGFVREDRMNVYTHPERITA